MSKEQSRANLKMLYLKSQNIERNGPHAVGQIHSHI